MGIIIRCWDSETNYVATRYLGSKFIGRSTAEDVLQTFLAGISDLDQSKILQVVSESPNVNLLFLKKLTESREEKELLPLLNIGSCGLHVITNSFKTGAKKGSNWEIQKLLKAMWKFLQETPTRRFCMKMYRSVWTIPCSFLGMFGARMRKVLKDQK